MDEKTNLSGFIDRFDDKLLIRDGHMADLRPREANHRRQRVLGFIDSKTNSVNTENEASAPLVLDGERRLTVHLEVLCNLQILNLGVLNGHVAVVSVVTYYLLIPLKISQVKLVPIDKK